MWKIRKDALLDILEATGETVETMVSAVGGYEFAGIVSMEPFKNVVDVAGALSEFYEWFESVEDLKESMADAGLDFLEGMTLEEVAGYDAEYGQVIKTTRGVLLKINC